MQRISSNSTLFLKIFLPTFWIVFFGIFTGAVLLTKAPFFGGIPAVYFKTGLVLFFLGGTAALYFTILKLLRVELDESYVYASNYFKTYRYPWHNVEKIAERNLGLFHLVSIHLKTPGKFGTKLNFLLDEAMLKDFLEKHPDVAGTMSFFEIKSG
ncbi:MAG: hypothetical protein ACE5FF_02395 [Saprospiraceae bacterium]